MKKEEVEDFHFRSETGIVIHSTVRFSEIYSDLVYTKTPWSHKQRERLIWKLKTNKARLNKFIIALLMIPSVIAILSVVFLLAYFVGNQITGIFLGIIGAQLCIVAYYFWSDRFETEPYLIKPKHRARIYN